MRELSLSDVKAFHGDLLSVVAAGIPIAEYRNLAHDDLLPSRGRGQSARETDIELLREALATIELRMSAASIESEQLVDALESAAQVSPDYVNALRAWTSSDHDPTAFDVWANRAQNWRRQNWNLRIAWVQPLVWLVVGYFALTFISLSLAPQFQELGRQLHVAPGYALTLLLGIHRSYPIWGPVAPLLFVAFAFFLYRRSLPIDRNNKPSKEPTAGTAALRTAAPRSDMWNWMSEPVTAHTAGSVVLLGGIFVLAIALCVFGPLLELLYNVALPVGIATAEIGLLSLGLLAVKVN